MRKVQENSERQGKILRSRRKLSKVGNGVDKKEK